MVEKGSEITLVYILWHLEFRNLFLLVVVLFLRTEIYLQSEAKMTFIW